MSTAYAAGLAARQRRRAQSLPRARVRRHCCSARNGWDGMNGSAFTAPGSARIFEAALHGRMIEVGAIEPLRTARYRRAQILVVFEHSSLARFVDHALHGVPREEARDRLRDGARVLCDQRMICIRNRLELRVRHRRLVRALNLSAEERAFVTV